MSVKWSLAGLIFAGIAAALCAAVLVAASSTGKDKAETATPKDVEIAVAAKDLTPGKVVEQGHVVHQTIPAEGTSEDALAAAQVIGKVLTVPMVQGQMFTSECFAKGDAGLLLASALPNGMRAVSVSLSFHSGLKGLLYPGSVVDVVASFRGSTSTGTDCEPASITLLQGVQVLAIDSKTVVSEDEQMTGNSKTLSERKLIVTLMLEAEQAEFLKLAMEYGTITLAMRNPLDTESKEGGFTTLAELQQGPEAPQHHFLKEVAAGFLAACRSAPRPSPIKEAAEPPPPPVVAEAPEETPAWETTVIRGEIVKKVLFTAPKDLQKPVLRADEAGGVQGDSTRPAGT